MRQVRRTAVSLTNSSRILMRALDRFLRRFSAEQPVICMISPASYPSISFMRNIMRCKAGRVSTMRLTRSASSRASSASE